jgi:hypothetical protein
MRLDDYRSKRAVLSVITKVFVAALAIYSVRHVGLLVPFSGKLSKENKDLRFKYDGCSHTIANDRSSFDGWTDG